MSPSPLFSCMLSLLRSTHSKGSVPRHPRNGRIYHGNEWWYGEERNASRNGYHGMEKRVMRVVMDTMVWIRTRVRGKRMGGDGEEGAGAVPWYSRVYVSFVVYQPRTMDSRASVV
jgi:hypothetical protein